MPKHGGKRLGAGRPLGSGRYGEATKPERVPLGMLNAFKTMRSIYITTKDVLTAARLLVAQLETNEKKNG